MPCRLYFFFFRLQTWFRIGETETSQIFGASKFRQRAIKEHSVSIKFRCLWMLPWSPTVFFSFRCLFNFVWNHWPPKNIENKTAPKSCKITVCIKSLLVCSEFCAAGFPDYGNSYVWDLFDSQKHAADQSVFSFFPLRLNWPQYIVLNDSLGSCWAMLEGELKDIVLSSTLRTGPRHIFSTYSELVLFAICSVQSLSNS